MGTAKKAKYPIGFYICCITYTFERFAHDKRMSK